MTKQPSLLTIFLVALRLGCTSFGGPVAHLGFFQREYVQKLRWLDDATYGDLVALCQFLPGPASSQVGFGVGYLQKGMVGGLLAWLGFTLPSAVLMILFATGVHLLGDLSSQGWLGGMKAAAVAVVLLALQTMFRSLCPDWPRRGMTLAASLILLLLPGTWTQIGVITLGALGGLVILRKTSPKNQKQRASTSHSTKLSFLYLSLFIIGLITFYTLTPTSGGLALFGALYQCGSLVFGGGHVVLPLLEQNVVSPGWLSHDQFLAGYGAAQAVPGPLFTLSSYIGTVSQVGPGGFWGGCMATLAIFLPSFLLVAAALPHWQTLRGHPKGQTALAGTNAAVVGLLGAAFVHPVCTAGIIDWKTALIAAGACLALGFFKRPAWQVIPGSALIGSLVL